MSKIDRQKVIEKFDSHCAYCGCIITLKTMQVDHIDSKHLGGSDKENNLNPACRFCNNWKHSFNLEQFRNEISKQVARARTYSRNFRMAERYNLIEETGNRVVFYFEKKVNQTQRN